MSETESKEYQVTLPAGTKFMYDKNKTLLGFETPRSKPRKAVIKLSNKANAYEYFVSVQSKLSIDEIKEIATALIQ